jgi:CheY-like chemotaxis protein
VLRSGTGEGRGSTLLAVTLALTVIGFGALCARGRAALRRARRETDALREQLGEQDVRPLALRRVLIAEGGELDQRLLIHFLEELGSVVVAVEDGHAVLEETRTAGERGEPYDLVLIDVGTPSVGGLEAVRTLRSLEFKAPIVALSGSNLVKRREESMSAGCDGFLAKPYTREAVVALTRIADDLGPRASSEPILSAYADDDDMTELLELFRLDLREDVERIQVALETSNVAELESVAYQIKGCAGGYGFPRLSLQADRLEASIRNGAPSERVEAEAQALLEHCSRVVAEQ